MELESLFGLPAHPLLVHGAVVLMPLAAIATLVVALVPKTRKHYAPLALGLTVVAFGALVVTQNSGEALEHNVAETELVEAHTDMGESAMPFAVALLVASAGIAGTGLINAKAPQIPKNALNLGLVALTVLSSVGVTYKIVQIGHSGAKAAWSEVEAGGSGGGNDVDADHDGDEDHDEDGD